MPTIQYGSKSITVPDGLTDEQQVELLMDNSEGAKIPSYSNPMPSNQPVDHAASGIDPATLQNDQKWLDASRVMYKQHHGVDFDGTTEELANYGLNNISYFNYNTMGMAVNAAALNSASKEEKESFLYLMDTFDKTNMSWAGAGRFIGAAATDPVTYLGLGTLGIGLAGKAVGETVSKAAIRSAIQASIEAGIQSGAQSAIKQEAKINAGGQDEFSYGEVAKDTLVGGAFGAILGGGVGAAAAKWFPKKTPSGIPLSTLEEKPREMAPRLFGKVDPAQPGEIAVDIGSKLDKASRQEREFAALEPTPPKLPEGVSEAEAEALTRLHEAAQFHGEKIDLEQELAGLRERNRTEPRDVQVGEQTYTLDDNKPKDIDYEGLKVSEDEKAALEDIKAKHEAKAEAAGPVEDNRPRAKSLHAEQLPNLIKQHWETSWHDVSDNDAHIDTPDWFGNVKQTLDDMARALGMEPPTLHHGNPKDDGLGGVAYSHGHIILSRLSDGNKALIDGLHELGHQMEYAVLRSSPQEVQDAIRAAWREHKKLYGTGKTFEEHRPLTGSPFEDAIKGRPVDPQDDPYLHGYITDFSEWFAEQVQRHLTTKVEPTNVIEKFFQGIAEKWKLIYEKVTGKVPLHDEVVKFIESNWHGDLLKGFDKTLDLSKELDNLRAGAKEVDLLKDVDLRMPDPVDRVMRAIRDISPESGPPFKPHPQGKLEGEAVTPASILVGMDKRQITNYVQELVAKAVTPEQSLRLSAAFRVATNQLEAKAFNMWANYKLITDPAEKAAAFRELVKVEKLRDNIKAGDLYLSSMEGSALAQRRGSINTGEFRGVSEESILAEWIGDPALASPTEREAAKREYYRLVSGFYERAAAAAKVKALKDQLDNAVGEYFNGGGKFEDIMKLYKEMKEEQLKAADRDSKEFNLFKDSAKRILNDVNQVIISTVFSPATLMVNTIPSLVKTVAFPAFNALVKGPTDEAVMKEMLTFYHTMYNNIGVSWQMAKASWQFERSLMMTENYGNRFMEGAQGTGILDNRLGRALRFFPRVLTATDEFFQSMNYRGYVMGEAHYAAVRDANKAIAEGRMKASEKDAYVTMKLQQASDHMFANVQDKAHLLEWTAEVGRERGLSGKELDDWVKQQLTDHGHLMKEVSSESGSRYVEDLLFKRRFSGEGGMSEAAKKYEDYANNNPWMRTIGQLFFRTPVRVFEEGIRMTPGINLFAPNYLNDLRGVNGQAPQVRAMREAMLGFAITQWVMVQYASGNITGGGPMDYKTRRDMEGAGWQAYTLKTPAGDLNFRNLDPFVTPMKIIVNMMDNLAQLQHDKATGNVKPNAESEAMAMLGVAVGAVMRSVKDANLWDGINQMWAAGEKSVDPEHSGIDKFMVHFLGQKAAYVVPSVVSKSIGTQQTQLTNPASIWQYVEAKYAPNSTSVAHIHDALGNIRTQANPVSKLVGIQLSDEHMRQGGRSQKEIEVLRELAKLSVAGKTNFEMPTKDKALAPAVDDLRTTMTNDGKLTLYDRVNQFVRGSDMTDKLHTALVGKEHLPVAARVAEAKKIISAYRKQAFIKLWSEKTGMREDFIAQKRFEAESKAGFRDSNALPYLND